MKKKVLSIVLMLLSYGSSVGAMAAYRTASPGGLEQREIQAEHENRSRVRARIPQGSSYDNRRTPRNHSRRSYQDTAPRSPVKRGVYAALPEFASYTPRPTYRSGYYHSSRYPFHQETPYRQVHGSVSPRIRRSALGYTAARQEGLGKRGAKMVQAARGTQERTMSKAHSRPTAKGLETNVSSNSSLAS